MHAFAAAATALSIVLHPGDGAAAKHWTLRCGPTGGTLPHAASACAKLLRSTNPFAPTPRDMMCADVVYGPETADVTGVLRGRPVLAHLTRHDSCEEVRFMRVRFLFPVKLAVGGG
jgi:hypothetical protein